MKLILLFYLFFTLIFTSFRNYEKLTNENFDTELAKNHSLKDTNPELVLKNFKGLRDKSKNNIKQIKELTYEISLLLKNHLFNFDEAIIEANKGIELGKSTNDHLYLAKLYQIIGASYLENRFLDEGLSYLKLASNHLNQSPKSSTTALLKGKIYDNIGSYYEFKDDLNTCLFYKRKSLNEALKVNETSAAEKKDKYTMILVQLTNIGACHEFTNNEDSAGFYLEKAYDLIHKKQDVLSTLYHGDVYSRLSQYYYRKGEFQKSIDFAKTGLKYIVNVEDNLSKMYLYEALYLSYTELDIKDSLNKYSHLYSQKREFLLLNDKKETVKTANNLLDEEQNINKNRLITLILSVVIIALIIGYIIRIKFKKYQDNYARIIKDLKLQSEIIIHPEPVDVVRLQDQIAKKKSNQIPDETRQRLIHQLNDFEKSKKFLKPKFTINILATELKTNSTYLSIVIKEEKNKNFNQYLNQLRINYIVKLLYNEPNFREYKMSYLAEITGFSSREVFTTTFKKETGLSPFYFIEKLKKETK